MTKTAATTMFPTLDTCPIVTLEGWELWRAAKR